MDKGKLIECTSLYLPEFSEADIEAEARRMFQRSTVINDFLEGKVDAETFLDFLVEEGYDSTEVMDQAEENLEFVMNNGIVLE